MSSDLYDEDEDEPASAEDSPIYERLVQLVTKAQLQRTELLRIKDVGPRLEASRALRTLELEIEDLAKLVGLTNKTAFGDPDELMRQVLVAARTKLDGLRAESYSDAARERAEKFPENRKRLERIVKKATEGHAPVPSKPPPKPPPPKPAPSSDLDVERLQADFIYFCAVALEIAYRPGMLKTHPYGGFGPFHLTSAQQKLAALLVQRLLVDRKPLRLVVLKSRQLGCTTLLLAFWLWLLLRTPHFHVIFLIDKDLHARTKREDFVRWVTAIEAKFGDLGIFARLEKREEKALFFSNGSRLFFESAEAPNPGTSEMFHVLHESEKPKWPANRARQVETSITPGLPAAPMTVHVDESTAEGMDDFALKWKRAVEGRGSGGDLQVLPVFLPWFISEEYALTPPSDFQFLNEDEELGDVVGDGDGERRLTEEQYAQAYQLSPAQVYWRRQKIKDTFKGVRASFDQEYPTTPAHAWRAVQLGFFSGPMLDRMERGVREPLWTGRIVDAGGHIDHMLVQDWTRLAPQVVYSPDGELEVYEEPIPGEVYFLGADVCEGKTVESESGELETDWTRFSVKRSDGRTVALWSSQRHRPEELWIPLVLLARYFYSAWVNGERNGPGLVLLSYFYRTGYPHMLVYSKPEGAALQDRTWTQVNQLSRDRLLLDLRASYATDPAIVSARAVLDELRVFVKKMQGRKARFEAMSGHHDDLVFAEAHAEKARRWFYHEEPPRRVERAVPVREHEDDAPASFHIDDTDLGLQLADEGVTW